MEIMVWNLLPTDEKFNVFTHAMGIVLSLVGIPIILYQSINFGSSIVTISVTIFCITLLWMYISSTLYHLAISTQSKKLWRMIDHISIFGLIGGTYTPFIIIFYNQFEGWIFLLVLWSIICVAALLKIFFTGRFKTISTLLYLFCGWMVVIIYTPVTTDMGNSVYYLLLLGGLSYTGGVIFYLWKQLPFNHGIWHLFVLGGSCGHYLSIYFCLVPI